MSPQPVDQPDASRVGFTLLLLSAVAGYVTWLMWSMANLPYDSWAPLVLAPLLLLASAPVLLRIARSSRAGPSFGLLFTALVLKLAAALAYVKITDVVYDGVADYTFYHETGALLAESYRVGDWGVDVDAVPGYGFVQMVTAVIYRFTGTSLLVGFLVFSWLAYWGLVMICVAVRTAVPGADHRRFSMLVLLLPSTIYWSSSLGKDSWVTFGIGTCALGVARLMVHRPSGLPIIVLGLAVTGMVRPHVALILFVALTVAYLGRRSQARGLGAIGKAFGLCLLAAVGVILLRYATEFLKIENLSPSSVNDALDDASASSAGGEASIDPPVGGSLTRIPWAIVTVLFRPFLWEAHNLQAAVAAIECSFLVFLAWLSRGRLRQLPRLLRREPYVLFVVTYSALFIFAFSSFANLGTLARERVQLFPLLLVLLCLPTDARVRRRPSGREVTSVPQATQDGKQPRIRS